MDKQTELTAKQQAYARYLVKLPLHRRNDMLATMRPKNARFYS